MTLPYHSHNFEIPVASRQDILDGAAADKVAVPACLGSAAAADSKDFATAAQGIKADNAVPAARFIRAGNGLAGGGALTQDVTLALAEERLQSIAAAQQKAEEALQKADKAGDVRKSDLGGLAFKNKLAPGDIAASGVPSSGTVLYGDGVWRVLPAGGGNSGGAGGNAGGDMYRAFYDPHNKQADSFDMDNMAEGRTHKILSAVNKTKLEALPADAVSAKIAVRAGSGLAGGGALAGDVTIKLSDAAAAAVEKGKTAVQKSDCGILAFKNKAAVTDIEAGGPRSGKSFLRGDGVWAEIVSGGEKGDKGAPGKDGVSIIAVRIV